MLVPFAIDAHSLDPDVAWTPATIRTCYQGFLDAWERYGLLVHDSEQFENSVLFKTISTAALPPKIKIPLLALLERNPPVPCGNAWGGVITPETILSCAPSAAIALIDDTHAMLDFGFGDDEDERPLQTNAGESIDICRFQSVRRAAVFRRADALASKHIEPNDTWQNIWSSRFAGLAGAPIKHISIVDRYAAKQHSFCSQTQLSGLARFLKQLCGANGIKRTITVFSAWTEDLKRSRSFDDIKREVGEIVQNLGLASIRRLTLCILPDTEFGRLAHDRFIRFGESYVWDIGIGLDAFQGPCAGRSSSATFESGLAVPGYVEIEDGLRNAKEATQIRVIG